MTVKELIKYLSELPENSEVLISSDMEGNYFHQVHGVYSGYNARIDAYDVDVENAEDEGNCVIIWP